MKNRKLRKALLALCCAIALVAISVGATLAYLTDTDNVTNTFTVGNVKITLDETDVDDSTPNDDRDKVNSYKLMPGQLYVKDPTVNIDIGSEDCWIFVTVDNQIADIIDGDLKTQITTNNKWIELIDSDKGGTGVYYQEYVSGDSDKNAVKRIVFNNFKIKSDVDNEKLERYAGKTIIVNAYAIQKEGFSTAAAAWNAYQEQTATTKPTSDFFSSGMPVEPIEGTQTPGVGN